MNTRPPLSNLLNALKEARERRERAPRESAKPWLQDPTRNARDAFRNPAGTKIRV
jgi:hypothetical protein